MIEVNLLPDSQRSAARKRRKARRPSIGDSFRGVSLGRDPWTTAVIAAGVVVTLGVLGLWLAQRAEASGLEDRLAEATADSARLADLRAISDSLTERRRMIRERITLIERLDRGRFIWPHLLDEISRALPQFAWITNLQQTSPIPNVAVQIQGMAANPLTITEFVRNLQASPYIDDVRIVGSQQQEIEDGLTVQGFTLVATYAAPAEGAERTQPLVSPEE